MSLRSQIWILRGATKRLVWVGKNGPGGMMGEDNHIGSFHHIKKLWFYLEVLNGGKKQNIA